MTAKSSTGAKRRALAGVLAAGGLAFGALLFSGGAASADIITDEAEVALATFPSTKTAVLDQFDDVGGTLVLDNVTVIATVEGEIDGALLNLSDSHDKNLTASVDASITVNGTEVTDLSAGASASDAFTLAPGAQTPFVMNDAGTATATITDPARLTAFVGSGTLDYLVRGQVQTTVTGPAPYKSTGVTNGLATVRIEYEFHEEGTSTTPPETTGPETTPPETTLPETTPPETTLPPTTLPPTTAPPTTLPPTTAPPTTLPPTTAPPTTLPPTTLPPTTT
jgi:hypothetical protein